MLIIYLPTILWASNLGGSSSLGWLGQGLGWPYFHVWQLASWWSGSLNWNSSCLFHMVSHPFFMVLHTVSRFRRVARVGKPQWTSTYLSSLCLHHICWCVGSQCKLPGQDHIQRMEEKFHLLMERGCEVLWPPLKSTAEILWVSWDKSFCGG